MVSAAEFPLDCSVLMLYRGLLAGFVQIFKTAVQQPLVTCPQQQPIAAACWCTERASYALFL